MKKRTVRVFAIVLAALMVLSLLPLAAYAQETEAPEGFKIPGFDLIDGRLVETEHIYNAEVAEEGYLVDPSEPGDCQTPAKYWRSCGNVNPLTEERCGHSAGAAYEAEMQQMMAEMNSRLAAGEKKEDLTQIAAMMAAEIEARYESYKFEAYGDHQWVEVEAQPATCGSEGCEAFRYCEVCGAGREAAVVIPATGEHTWGEYEIVTEATCSEAGLAQRACAVCGATEDQEIPATGEHNFVDGVCTVCNAEDPNYVPPVEETTENGEPEQTENGTTEGTENGTTEGTENGTTEGTENGTTEGTENGTTEGTENGTTEGTENGTTEGTENGTTTEGTENGTTEGTENGEPEKTENGEPEKTEDGEPEKTENGESEKTENGESEKTENGESEKTENGEPEKTENGEPEKTEDGESEKTENGEPEKTEDGEPEKTENGEPEKTENGESEKTENGESEKTEDGEPEKTEDGEPEKTENGEPEKTENGESEKTENDQPKTYTGEVSVAQTAASEDVVDSFVDAAWGYLGLTSENTAGVSVQNVTPYKEDGTELSDEEIPEEGIDFEMDIPEGFDPDNQDIEIYHRNKDGVWEKMQIVDIDLEDNKITVRKVRSFSPFALIVKRLDKEEISFVTINRATFNSGSDLFETPVLQKDGAPVSEAFSGETLTVSVVPTASAPADQTYEYRWIRDTGSTRTYITNFTDVNTYTLTDADCGSSIYCSVNVKGNRNEAELSTGVHARKIITMTVSIRPDGGLIGGNVKLEFTDTLHSEITFESINYPSGAVNTIVIDKIRDTNGIERPLMTEDSLTITVEPDTEKGYYVREVTNGTTKPISATSEKTSYKYESLGTTNNGNTISVFFDLAECQPNEKETQGPTTEDDQKIHNNTKIWEEFKTKYVQKPGQDTPFPVVYYYVTPKWLGAPTAPMGSNEIKAVGGFSFKLGLPSGVTSANFYDYEVKVYHYVTDQAIWEEVAYTTKETIEKGEDAVQIENFTNFSPFAVVARPSANIEFVNLEPTKGSVSNAAIPADDKGDVVLPKAEFTAQDGYTFAGWLVDGKLMQPGETVHSVFADKEVYPKWVSGYSIIFDDNDADNQNTYGALVTGQMDKQTVFTDFAGNYYDGEGNKLTAAPTLNGNAYQLKNHSFQGWSTKPGGGDNTAVYKDKQSVADIANEAKKDITLYAVWKREQVSVIFNANGGSGTMDEQKGQLGGSITLTANKFTPPDANKLFAGWSKSADGNIEYNDGQTIDVPDTDTTLYAVWREKVTIKFNPKSTSDVYGGTGTGTMRDQEVPSGAEITLNRCTFTAPDGRAFAFWNDRQDGTGNSYPDRYTGSWTGDVELYAQWGDKLTIHYDPNGGNGKNYYQIAAKGVDVTLATAESASYTRSGYKFLGWDTVSSKKSNPKYQGGQTVTGGFDQSDVTLYAIWEQVEITGDVVVTGSLSDTDGLGFVGELLTAEIFNERKFTDFTYEWTDENGNVLGRESTYRPTVNDFGKTIVCTVTAHSPYVDSKTSNSKTIGIEEEDKRIINNGETEIDYVYGLYPGMYYSIDGGKKQAVALDKYGRFPLTKSGTYYFYPSEADSTILAVVNVENWYTVGYYTYGSGTVRFMLDNMQLTSATRFTSTLSPYIEYYSKINGYTCWIVKEGANIGTFTLTVTPASGNYAHVYLNEKLIDSFGSATRTTTTTSSSPRTNGTAIIANPSSYSPRTTSTTSTTNTTHYYYNSTPLSGWLMYRVVFSSATTSPRTADESNLGLWSALCMISLTGAAVILTETRKRRKNEQ